MTQHIAKIVALALFSLSLSGCAIAAAKRQNEATQKFIADGQKRAAEQAKKQLTDYYVVSDSAWICPTKEQAVANASCDGGKEYVKAQVLKVMGQAPEGDVWKASWFDSEGQKYGFVALAHINELPDTSELDAHAKKVDAEIPAEQRIPPRHINFSDFLNHTEELAKRKLVLAMSATDFRDRAFDGDTMSATIYVAPAPGKAGSAPTLFRFNNAELANEWKTTPHSYRCGGAYCDKVVVVARLTNETVDRTDEYGNVKRLPVFVIESYADRYGVYGD